MIGAGPAPVVASSGYGHLIHLIAAAVPIVGLAGYVVLASLRASHRGSAAGSRSAGTPRTSPVDGAPALGEPDATAAHPDRPGVPATPAWSRHQVGVFLPARGAPAPAIALSDDRAAPAAADRRS